MLTSGLHMLTLTPCTRILHIILGQVFEQVNLFCRVLCVPPISLFLFLDGVIVLVCKQQGLARSSVWPQTQSNIPASTSQGLSLQAFTTRHNFILFYFFPVLEFKPKASHVLGKHCPPLAYAFSSINQTCNPSFQVTISNRRNLDYLAWAVQFQDSLVYTIRPCSNKTNLL